MTPNVLLLLAPLVSLSKVKLKLNKMNPHSILASAAINIGLALITLTLFSILKKQPSNACIYYAHRLSQCQYIPFDNSTIQRFIPSISWISKAAFHVTEDDILQSHGLDALVIIRLFKFGLSLSLSLFQI